MEATTVRGLMTAELVTVPQDMEVEHLCTYLTRNGLTGAPVVDGEGRFLGTVSVEDIPQPGATWGGSREEARAAFRALLDRERVSGELLQAVGAVADLRVADICRRELPAIEADISLEEAARFMRAHRLHRVVVVEDGSPVGMLSTSDLLGYLIVQGGTVEVPSGVETGEVAGMVAVH